MEKFTLDHRNLFIVSNGIKLGQNKNIMESIFFQIHNIIIDLQFNKWLWFTMNYNHPATALLLILIWIDWKNEIDWRNWIDWMNWLDELIGLDGLIELHRLDIDWIQRIRNALLPFVWVEVFCSPYWLLPIFPCACVPLQEPSGVNSGCGLTSLPPPCKPVHI